MSAAASDTAAARRIRIVVIDDHTLFRRGITALLSRVPGFEVVGEAADGFDGIKAVVAHRPDVVLLDLHMPGISGIDAMQAILKEAPGQHIVMLTVSEEADDLMLALRSGALGYLLKNIESDFLVDSVRRAADGESVMSPEMTTKLMREVRVGATRRGPAGVEPARARDSRLPRPRRQQQGNRARSRRRRKHGQDPRPAHPAQARPHEPGPGRRLGRGTRPRFAPRRSAVERSCVARVERSETRGIAPTRIRCR